MQVHGRATPTSLKFASTHLYTWAEIERNTVREKCLAHEHYTETFSNARTYSLRSWRDFARECFCFGGDRGWRGRGIGGSATKNHSFTNPASYAG